jgi:hypothetical protein
MHWLIGLHAMLGEIGAFSFFWIFIDLLGPNSARSFVRARYASLLGVTALMASWIVGGSYYLGNYQSIIKPVIKDGPQPWSHLVMTEAKEHIFFFLPFLAIYIFAKLRAKPVESLVADEQARRSIMTLSILTFALGLAMAAMGYLISSGFRAALEKGIAI